jgi:hypothetical membrane protein
MQIQRVDDNLGISSQGIVTTKRLLLCGAIADPLFIAMFLIEGATRTNYNPLRHPISSLALGDFGWMQSATFIVSGLLMIAFAIGLRRALRPRGGSIWGSLLVGIWGFGLFGAGIFITDPVSGYPPGTPAQGEPTTIGNLHDLFSLLAFVGLVVACFVFSGYFARRGNIGWAVYSALSGVVFVVAFFLASAGFTQSEGLVNIGGLIQRIQITTGWSWLTLLAVHFLKALPETPRKRPS